MGLIYRGAAFLLLLMHALALPENKNFIAMLQSAFAATNGTINSLLDEWQVHDYPNFLKSCFMPKHSWDIMKLKFMDRILSAENSKSRKQFVASFLGSSVTAGQDSYHNQSTPIVTGNILKAAFSALNIDFIVKNVALIGNPCMPYDVCVKIFVGLDADIVHWEQTYFCGPFGAVYILEQFVRQAMTIPTRPIVVFSESSTGHWNAGQCKKGPHVKTSHENELLKSSDLKLVSKLNKDEYDRAWNFLSHIDRKYHQAGIQTFQHEKHTDYACLGPYIKDWEAGAASWHPSVIGHRLRASHHAYFWLLILRDAITDLIKSAHHKSKGDIIKHTASLVEHFYATSPGAEGEKEAPPVAAKRKDIPLSAIQPKFKSPFVDDIKCYTDYVPRNVQNASLSNVIVSLGGWKQSIHNDLEDKHATKHKLSKGFVDFMHIFYGNKDSGAISLLASLSKPGPIFICQSPATWGKMPDGFKFMWETKYDVFITPNVPINLPTLGSVGSKLDTSPGAFKFQKATARSALTNHVKDLDICVQVLDNANKDGSSTFAAGNYVVTIFPKEAHKIIVAWLLTA